MTTGAAAKEEVEFYGELGGAPREPRWLLRRPQERQRLVPQPARKRALRTGEALSVVVTEISRRRREKGA